MPKGKWLSLTENTLSDIHRPCVDNPPGLADTVSLMIDYRSDLAHSEADVISQTVVRRQMC